MKFALIADPHLSDAKDTPQEESFDWALGELERLMPDACIWLGDITACGSPDAVMRFRQKIDSLSCPSVTVPGNSDIRTEATAPILERFLMNYPEGLRMGNIRIVGMNTSHDCLSQSEKDRLSHLVIREDILLCSHQPSKYLDESSLNFLKNWIETLQNDGHRVIAWVHGHIHVYREGEFEGIPTVSVRALDLDKCCGGDAHICMMTVGEGLSPTVEEVTYSRGTLATWSERECREFADLLGITCFDKSKIERDMPFAIVNGIRHLEWRSIKEGELSLIEAWRRAGGQSFSLHFPSLGLDGTEITGVPSFSEYARDAIRAEANMVTVHPPYVLNEMMLQGSAFDALADAAAEYLRPVAEAGIDILVENNHTTKGTPRDPMKRGYGCSPAELVGWRNALIERLGKGRCHLRLDVGHARNNKPLSQDYPIGKWYALVGRDTRGYHIHQIVTDKNDKRMKNHHPITGLHDGLVSFDGFLWAWHCGILNHSPVILEIREGEGACATWNRMQDILRKASM